jgi:hypothetical protein
MSIANQQLGAHSCKGNLQTKHQLKGSDKGGSKDKLITSVQDKYNTPDEERSKEKKL